MRPDRFARRAADLVHRPRRGREPDRRHRRRRSSPRSPPPARCSWPSPRTSRSSSRSSRRRSGWPPAGSRAARGSYVAAGLLVGLASLARNDGFILGVAVGLVFVWDRVRAWRRAAGSRRAIPFRAAVGCVVLYLVVMAPWLARQLADLRLDLADDRRAAARSGSGRSSEWNSITADPSLVEVPRPGARADHRRRASAGCCRRSATSR